MDTTQLHIENQLGPVATKEFVPISERTKSMGKLDEWNQRKFAELQENTQQQFVEYHRMLAYYQNELNKFRGKNIDEEKILEDKQKDLIIPQEEKAFSAVEFDSWSQKKFEELEENIKRQFYEYDLLLGRYKKQLDKYRGIEVEDVQAIKKSEAFIDSTKVQSIFEKIEQFLADFMDKVKPNDKESKSNGVEANDTELDINQRTWKWLKITCVFISLITIVVFIFYWSWQKR